MLKIFSLFYIFILLFTAGKLSASVEVVIAEQPRISLQPYLSWYFDPSGQAGIEEVITTKNLFSRMADKINFERTQGAHWLHFKLWTSASAIQKNWLLALSYTQLNQIDLYSQSGDSPLQHQQWGDSLPVSQQSTFSAYPVFPLALQVGESTNIHIRIHSSTSINVPLTLWQEAYFTKQELKKYLIVQESLNNAVKHSQASHIEVKLAQQQQNIILSSTMVMGWVIHHPAPGWVWRALNTG